MNKTKSVGISFFLLIFLAINFPLSAQKLRIAVAANAQGVIKDLQADFRKRTGIETEAIIGASGKLTAQIMNGAPYAVFLSADTEFPDKLYAEGFGLQKPKIYALGSLIICGFAQGDIKNWQALLSSEQVRKIAIANPKTAPYGRAAEESLKFYKLDGKVESKLVFGESIAQVNTYLQTGVVNVGFTTESFLYENSHKSGLKWARIDEKSYGKIEQAVILLSYAKKSGIDQAQKFYDYLSSVPAKKIIANNGYHLPK
ncbi:molybdate ABC transporter substrate-binding protein [Pedobacter rhodius]|uniref:Molybdate ABC transporter substrate-binding protein n=1 Tax=Pedobacter rhodius TaxID=3004098 RepID=A0ABT4L1Q3_9SPHI|nr:molybdate ABC transporter substrate-binding protein [Pedobacter sp. SJ11]MCZ4225113.1 molybdate ABC transporter substrate-binding protein [Pedobacter sp. SJ11]